MTRKRIDASYRPRSSPGSSRKRYRAVTRDLKQAEAAQLVEMLSRVGKTVKLAVAYPPGCESPGAILSPAAEATPPARLEKH
jgi:hypothetical protein